MTAPETAPIISPDASSTCPSAEASLTDNRIEIELGNGRLVRVGAGVDQNALKRVLDVLDGLAASTDMTDRKPRP